MTIENEVHIARGSNLVIKRLVMLTCSEMLLYVAIVN